MDRRSFLKAAVLGVPAAAVGGAGYGLYEAGRVAVERPQACVPRLPAVFDGFRVAFLADIHHGPYVDLDHVAAVVRTTLALQPDAVVLGGDYSAADARYVGPCFEVLSGLKAPYGVFGVLGNHDYWDGVAASHAGFRASKIMELTNAGVWLERGSHRFRLAGVDDLWCGRQEPVSALGDATAADACVVVSHNPDFAEKLRDDRVGLVLSGHTHGGQLYVPGFGAPIVPSRYGQKYLKGMVQAPATQVYVSRGLGTVAAPMRFRSPPELTLLTLRSA